MITKYYEKLLPLHTEIFKVQKETVKYKKHLQEGLFGMAAYAHVRMGLFYEMLSVALFGGELFDTIYKENGWRSFFHPKRAIRPDVLDEVNKFAIESKASRSGHQTNLMDRQVEAYEFFLHKYPNYQLFYVFYRHHYEKIMKSNATTNELFNDLSKCTDAAIVLPYSIIWHLWKHEDFKRYTGPNWVDCTRVGSKAMNRFLFEPESMIESIGLKVANFIIERSMLQKNVKIENNEMDPLPIIRIKDADHKLWYRRVFDAVPF